MKGREPDWSYPHTEDGKLPEMPKNQIIHILYRERFESLAALIRVGAPIFTYTHEPDDNELYYVRGALCHS